MKKTLLTMLLTAAVMVTVTMTGRRAIADNHKRSPEAQAALADIAKTLGFVPGFLDALPDPALPGTWEEMKGLQLNPNSALPGRVKELIGLGVASQIPCRYCIYAHDAFARLNGASQPELGEAVALAGEERHWSAYFYGMQLDETKFRAEIARIVENAKKPAPPAAAITVVDAKTARQDIEHTLGFVPEFLNSVPDSVLPGAWHELKNLKLSTSTKLNAKNKALIALAVGSQVPSHACIVSETEFAKLAGANEREINEAVGMAALTRNLSTLLNGLQIDETSFRADINRVVNGVKAAQKKAAATTASKP
jgi:AhpD family alkylhydroperoxidase